MPNEVKIKIVADKPDTSGFKDVNEELKKTQAEAKATTRSTEDLNEQFKKTGVSADDLGDSIKASGDAMTDADRAGTQHKNTLSSLEDQYKKVNADIATSRGELVKLTRAFADTDDAAQRLDVGKAIDKLNADLKRSTAAKKVLLNVEPRLDESGGSQNRLIAQLQKISPALGKAVGNQWGLAIAGGIAVAIGPELLSAAASGIIGGVGIGGIVGGIALAMQDPEVQVAANTLTSTFIDTIGKSATKWFQAPILDAIPVARGFLLHINDDAERIFRNLAPYIKPLVEDIGAFAENFTGALVKVSSQAGPAIAAIGGSVKLIGDGIGDFLVSISANGETAAGNLELVAGALADVLKYTGDLINVATKITDNPWLTGPLMPLLRQHYKELAGASKDASEATGTVAKSMTDAEMAAIGERDALEGLASELKAQTDPVFAVINAQDKLKEAQQRAKDAQKQGKKGTDDYNKAIRDAALASLDLEGAVGKLGQTFTGKLTPEMIATLESAGFTKKEIKNLQDQFYDTKDAGDKFAKDYEANATVNGVNPAKRQLTELERLAKSYAKTWTATMITNFVQTGKPSSSAHYNPQTLGHGLAHGGIKGAASGMIGSDLTWVGEQGPELVTLPVGSTVHSAPDSQRMAGAWGGGGDGGGQPIVVVIELDGQQVAKAVVEPLRGAVRQLGAGSVQRYLGQAGVK